MSQESWEKKQREKEKEQIPDPKPTGGFPSMLITIRSLTLSQALSNKSHHLSFPSSLWVNFMFSYYRQRDTGSRTSGTFLKLTDYSWQSWELRPDLVTPRATFFFLLAPATGTSGKKNRDQVWSGELGRKLGRVRPGGMRVLELQGGSRVCPVTCRYGPLEPAARQ